MPNQPAEDTATVSFTLPRDLLEKVKSRAKGELTNTSDIIRRALMNYLSPEERALVMEQIEASRPGLKSKKAPVAVRYAQGIRSTQTHSRHDRDTRSATRKK